MASGDKTPIPGIPIPSDGPVIPLDPEVVKFIEPEVIDPVTINPIIINPPLPLPAIINDVTPPTTNQFKIKGGKSGDVEPYIFGRAICDPSLIGADDSGVFLQLDLMWGVGECDFIEGLFFDGTFEGRTDQLGNAEHFEGTSTQTASTIMVGLKGSYDDLPDICHSVIFMLPNVGLDVRGRVRGLKVRDPRVSPETVYSTNPALALAHILVASGLTIDWDSVGLAADHCDELIGSPGIKRWEIGGQLLKRLSLRKWVHTIATYANCYIDIQGGNAHLIPDTPRAANHTVTADDMIAGTVRVSRAGGSKVPEAVTVIGKTVDGDVISKTFGASGGAGTETKLNLPFFQSFDLIGRKAEETYNKAHNNLTLEFTGFDDGIQRTIGDVGTITNAQYGLSAQKMTLIKHVQDGRGRWKKTYYEHNNGNYSENTYTGSINDPGLDNPNNPPNGPTPTVTNELFTDGSGVTYARFKITFIGITWAYLRDYWITVVGGESVALAEFLPSAGAGSVHTIYTTIPLIGGIEYLISVYVRSNTLALSTTPGTALKTPDTANNALLNEGVLENMHVYILDGDGTYCTTSLKTAGVGETWASRFSSSPLGGWVAGETWLGNQVCETTFQTEIWDSGTLWSGLWSFIDLDFSELAGATRANFVALSGESSPLSFADNSGLSFSGEARYMKAKATVSGSPIGAGEGLHIKLPVTTTFLLGG